MKQNDEDPKDTIDDGGTSCSTDADCADGYICSNGRCVKKGSTIPTIPPPVGRPTNDVKED